MEEINQRYWRKKRDLKVTDPGFDNTNKTRPSKITK